MVLGSIRFDYHFIADKRKHVTRIREEMNYSKTAVGTIYVTTVRCSSDLDEGTRK